MEHKKLQDHIGHILDSYGLRNISALIQKAQDLKTQDPHSREAQLLDFVVFAYEQDCDDQDREEAA